MLKYAKNGIKRPTPSDAALSGQHFACEVPMAEAPPRETLRITVLHKDGNTVVVFDDPDAHLQVPSPGDMTRTVVVTGQRLITVDDQTPRKFRVEVKAYRTDSETPARRSGLWLGVDKPVAIGTEDGCLTYRGLPEGTTSFTLLESDGRSATLRLQKAWCSLHESSVTRPGEAKPRRLDDIPMVFEPNADEKLVVCKLENLVANTKLALALTGGTILTIEIKR